MAFLALFTIAISTNTKTSQASPSIEDEPEPLIAHGISYKQVNRAQILDNYLHSKKSPIAGQGATIVAIADKYQLDYKLLVAISGIESSLCKRIPYQSNNCWGWGIYGKNILKFNSFEEGFEKVAKGLSENYVKKGLDTPEKIGRRYNPGNPVKWAAAVNQFAKEIEKSASN